MREDTKQLIKKQINILNEKIDDKEDKVRNWNAVYLTGLVGGTIGVIGLDKGKIIADLGLDNTSDWTDIFEKRHTEPKQKRLADLLI